MTHSSHGIAVYMSLICRIYHDNGFFAYWGEDILYAVQKDLGGISLGKIEEIVRDCVKFKLFDGDLFHNHKVLTSTGIQTRWVEVVKKSRKKIDLNYLNDNLSYCLKPINVTFNDLNATFNDLNVTTLHKNEHLSDKVNKSKINEIKLNKNSSSSNIHVGKNNNDNNNYNNLENNSNCINSKINKQTCDDWCYRCNYNTKCKLYSEYIIPTPITNDLPTEEKTLDIDIERQGIEQLLNEIGGA